MAASVTVCDPRHNKLIGLGNKSDDDDAETLANLLRLGAVKAVYKGDDQQRQIKELRRAYSNLVEDSTRIQNRLKACIVGVESTARAIPWHGDSERASIGHRSGGRFCPKMVR